MNRLKLKAAEKAFMEKYPGGFTHPEMQAISKKHKPEKMHNMALEFFGPDAFGDTDAVIEHMIKLVSSSSMVSVFEKPKFRDFARALDHDRKQILTKGLYELIHGDEEAGFDTLVDILKMDKLAKWTLVTVYRAYYYPKDDVFIKPTTVKGVIRSFEIPDLVYKPAPTYDFYTRYRDEINSMKKEVTSDLAPGNAAFSGFLMMSMDE